MSKLKAGQWFADDRWSNKILLLTTKPDCEGDLYCAVHYGDSRGTGWWSPEYFRDECTPLKRQPWIVRPFKQRSDDYIFTAAYSPNGKQALIVAGCRCFTVKEAKAHWSDRRRDYDCDDHAFNTWSLRFVEKFEKHLDDYKAAL